MLDAVATRGLAESETETRAVALIGNPNTGKSTLFGALSGVRQRVGNYPGVTVEKKLGGMTLGAKRWTLVDLPGTYSLAPRSPDEQVAVDVLLGRQADLAAPDVIVCVVDASNLERNLYLLSQLLELDRPIVVALTMVDVAEGRGMVVDVARLSANLGLPVVAVRAHHRIGLDALKEAIASEVGRLLDPRRRTSPFPEVFQAEVAGLAETLAASGGSLGSLPRYLVERLLLDTGGYFEAHVLSGAPEALHEALLASRARLVEGGYPVPAVEAMARYGWVAEVVSGVVTRPDESVVTLGDRIDRVLTHRVWGTLILALAMLLMFNAVFSWATLPMDAIDSGVGALAGLVESVLPEGALRSLLTEGVIGGIGSVVIFLPQILILFFFLALLEDCGYLARAAFLMDRLMFRLGLSGKSFIPLLSSFACAIPGVMAARVIENRRDRLTTILVAPLMSCSARLPVYALLIAAFIPDRRYVGGLIGLPGLTLFGLYGLGIVVAAVAALAFKRTLLRGETPPFVMELPSYKWPSMRIVVQRMVERAWSFVRRAGTLIFAVSVVMWGTLYYPRLPLSEAGPLLAHRLEMSAELDQARGNDDASRIAALESSIDALDGRLDGAQKRQSFLGRAGHWIEPAVRPLGWDWRIGSAVLASFPAREVVVASLGVIFDIKGADEEGGEGRLGDALKAATWQDSDRPLFNVPVALSIMVFFALCAQCGSTLVVIRRETGSWWWSALSFTYMTVLAYAGAFLTYRLGMLFT